MPLYNQERVSPLSGIIFIIRQPAIWLHALEAARIIRDYMHFVTLTLLFEWDRDLSRWSKAETD